MKKFSLRRILKYIGVALLVALCSFVIWQLCKSVPTEGDWKDNVKEFADAKFDGDAVTIHNVRNFQYDEKGVPTVEKYYDKTYRLDQIVKVWYIVDPFHMGSPFAHTFLSFEFKDGSFLAVTIEARLKNGQGYGLVNGLLHTFPLMYIPVDERDAVFNRTNHFKDGTYIYPLRATPEQGRLLLVDMLERMNDLAVHPSWYNGIFANCTSSIAKHVDKIWPGLLPKFDWQVLLTSYADELALSKGLLDTTLTLDQARKKFYVTDIALKVGYVDNFSRLIRGLDVVK